jgi:chromosome segregation ATPase
MSDGTMAIPVSPTEDEAMKLSQLFSHAANSIVNASTMPKTIADLTAKVEALTSQLEAKSVHATELDNALHEMRQARDNAVSSLKQLNDEHDITCSSLRVAQSDVHHWQGVAATHLDLLTDRDNQIKSLKHERDDNGFHAMELQEKLDSVEAKMRDLFGLVKPPAEVKHEPITPVAEVVSVQPVSDPNPAQIPGHEPPAPQPEPEPYTAPTPRYGW